jgi:hypothetical protein
MRASSRYALFAAVGLATSCVSQRVRECSLTQPCAGGGLCVVTEASGLRGVCVEPQRPSGATWDRSESDGPIGRSEVALTDCEEAVRWDPSEALDTSPPRDAARAPDPSAGASPQAVAEGAEASGRAAPVTSYNCGDLLAFDPTP